MTIVAREGFWLGKHEVTQAQWEAVTGSNPSRFRGPQNPVEQVSWTACQDFVAKVNEKVPGPPFRLPTEAEWEFACRAGSPDAYCYGDGKESLSDYAWYVGNANSRTHLVGEKKPNVWGLHDMHGNVCEWGADRHGVYPAAALTDPRGPSSGADRVGRGGGWSFHPYYCRAAFRSRGPPDFSASAVGFRLARNSVP